MKTTMTNESSRAFFDRPVTEAAATDPSITVARNGLSIMPWSSGLPLWRAALTQLSGATFFHCEPWIEALSGAYRLNLEVMSLHRQGELRAAGIFARSKRWLGTRLVSLPFSDCGEVLAVDEE